ncbi:putative defense protein 3 [Tachypleus tridentatus]|uniref:putative defense protein 3 n=1 Tax=Tachypleus tridentatus TaxID=6853 RepID=UPI003FD4AEEB
MTGVNTMNCGGGKENSLTHSSKTRKNTVTSVWTPASGFSGEVVFQASVVESYRMMWKNIESEIVSI